MPVDLSINDKVLIKLQNIKHLALQIVVIGLLHLCYNLLIKEDFSWEKSCLEMKCLTTG